MKHNPGRPLTALIALAVASSVLLAPISLAQTEPLTPVQEAQQELEQIESTLADGRARADQLRREIDEMSDDRAQQNAALIAAAQRVKLAEIEVEAMEERVNALIDEEAEVRARLDGADTDISSLLAALQRIGRSPPPAMLVKPTDALGSARGAMLMASALPQLRARADTVIEDLSRMVEIRTEAEAEQSALNANYATLFEEQLRIAVLIEARKQGVVRSTEALDQTEREAEQLAARSSSLTQLIDTLADRMSSASEAVSRLGRETIDGVSPEDIQLALADESRTEPALPFTLIRGYLSQPVFGVTVTPFAGDDGMGGISNGLSIVTRADADVVAPADGWVTFAGEFLNYGKIVILNVGDGYSILLAGLDAIGASPGQFVRMGESVGTMGSRTIGRAVTTSAGVSRPTLYIEIRDENGAIDPTGWWTNENRTQSG